MSKHDRKSMKQDGTRPKADLTKTAPHRVGDPVEATPTVEGSTSKPGSASRRRRATAAERPNTGVKQSTEESPQTERRTFKQETSAASRPPASPISPVSFPEPGDPLKAGRFGRRATPEKPATPPLRVRENMAFVGEVCNQGEKAGRWVPLKRFIGRFENDLDELAAVWADCNRGPGTERLWLTVNVDLGTRLAIKPTTFITADGTPLEFQVHRADGIRLEPAAEHRSLTPLRYHLSPSPQVALLHEYVRRSVERKQLEQRMDALREELANIGIPMSSVTNEAVEIPMTISRLDTDLLALELRLTEPATRCRCRICRRQKGT